MLSYERKEVSETAEKSKVTTRADGCKDSSFTSYVRGRMDGWMDRYRF